MNIFVLKLQFHMKGKITSQDGTTCSPAVELAIKNYLIILSLEMRMAMMTFIVLSDAKKYKNQN